MGGNWSTDRFHGNRNQTNDTNEIYESAPRRCFALFLKIWVT